MFVKAKQNCIKGSQGVLRTLGWISELALDAGKMLEAAAGDTLGLLVGIGTSWVVLLASFGIGHCCWTQSWKLLELTYRWLCCP